MLLLRSLVVFCPELFELLSGYLERSRMPGPVLGGLYRTYCIAYGG